jgi:hypothetical protein
MDCATGLNFGRSISGKRHESIDEIRRRYRQRQGVPAELIWREWGVVWHVIEPRMRQAPEWTVGDGRPYAV